MPNIAPIKKRNSTPPQATKMLLEDLFSFSLVEECKANPLKNRENVMKAMTRKAICLNASNSFPLEMATEHIFVDVSMPKIKLIVLQL